MLRRQRPFLCDGGRQTLVLLVLVLAVFGVLGTLLEGNQVAAVVVADDALLGLADEDVATLG
jgi:hypothetical protein